MKHLDKFNEYFKEIQRLLTNLYYDALRNTSRGDMNAAASYNEYIKSNKKLTDIEDQFRDFSRIEEIDNVIYNSNEFCLNFKITPIDFLDEYKNKEIFHMVMNQGAPIPGSSFHNIFKDDVLYWGYQADKASDAYFEIKLKNQSNINKVFISTTNEIKVKLLIKPDYESDFIEFGTREGRDHVWNFLPSDAVMLRFEANSNVFGVRYLNAGHAKYRQSGKIVSKPYDITGIHKIQIIKDQEILSGTNIKFFAIVNDNTTEIKDNDIIVGGVNWYDVKPSDVGYTLSGIPKTLITDSITARSDYKKWNRLYTIDYAWEEHTFSVVGEEVIIDITDDYRIANDSVTKVYTGSRIFEDNEDYGIEYLNDQKKIKIFIFNDDIDITNLSVDVQLRVAKIIKQIRTYVDSDKDQTITLDFDTLPPDLTIANIRQVNIKDRVENESLREVDIHANRTYDIDIYKGVNLIELEFVDYNGTVRLPMEYIGLESFDYNNFSALFSDMDYFGNNYDLDRAFSSDVSETTYYLQDDGTSYTLSTTASDVYLKYATELDTGLEFKVQVELNGRGGIITPSIRGYKIINSFK